MFGMFGKLTTTPGKRDEVVNIFRESATALEAMQGCHLYVVAISDSEPDALYITELWSDADAHRASLQLPDVQAAIKQAMPMLDMTGMEQTKFLPIVSIGIPTR